MEGGAWPFLVGGVICLVNSVNERDLNLLTMFCDLWIGKRTINQEEWRLRVVVVGNVCYKNFLEGLSVFNRWKIEAITGL